MIIAGICVPFFRKHQRLGSILPRVSAIIVRTGTPALSADESSVYFGAYTGQIYELDAASGDQRWNFSATFGVHGGVALAGQQTGAGKSAGGGGTS